MRGTRFTIPHGVEGEGEHLISRITQASELAVAARVYDFVERLSVHVSPQNAVVIVQ